MTQSCQSRFNVSEVCSVVEGNCDIPVPSYTLNPCCFGGKGFVTDPKDDIHVMVVANVCFVNGSVRTYVKVITDVLYVVDDYQTDQLL